MLSLSLSLIFIATLKAQAPTSTCKGAYEQCGGRVSGNAPYTGQTCCIAGYVCKALSTQYSQCNPGLSQAPPTNPIHPSNPNANTQPVGPVVANPPPVQSPPSQVPPVTQQPPATPVNPPAQQPPAQVSPVTPQQPPATPQYGYPQYNPYGPYGGLMPGLLDPSHLDCEFSQCRNRAITLQPAQGFTLNCQRYGQCDGLDLTLNVGHDPTNWGSGVSEINDLKFDAPQNGVTIRINGVYAGQNIEVNNVKCSVFGSCHNLKIIAGLGVELWNMNVHCDQPGSCTGCTINGQSCLMYSIANGNNNGYVPYGYGYTNQPGVQPPMPQQGLPQYPVF